MHKNKENLIYIKDWLELKPYNNQVPSDFYYLKLANKVKLALMADTENSVLKYVATEKETNLFSCFLASYFEDLVSHTNIYNAFIALHTEIYNKPLPFYAMKQHFHNDLNIQDINLLMWYYLNAVHENSFILPHDSRILNTANRVMDVFMAEWEYAPENPTLKSIYSISETDCDFLHARKLIDKVLHESYLFFPDTKMKLIKEQDEILSRPISTTAKVNFINEALENSISNSHTRLLALKGKDWAAQILGNEHPLYASLRKPLKRIVDMFFYKGKTDTHINFEQISTGIQFNVNRLSFEDSEIFDSVDSIAYLGLEQWENEWWNAGILSLNPYDKDLVDNTRQSAIDNFNIKKCTDVNAFLSILEKQQLVFHEVFNNKDIVFVECGKLKSELEKFQERYNAKYPKSKRTPLENAMLISVNTLDMDDTTDIVMFFNPHSGIEIISNIAGAFPSDDNPFFTSEEFQSHLLTVLSSHDVSKQLCNKSVATSKDIMPFFKKNIGKLILINYDFLLRFWKDSDYYSMAEKIAY